ncbi:MAG: protein kinase [Deltaproteobacteria bacterium]|nr:protein kinase [Deltaproteobacteria bacterium]
MLHLAPGTVFAREFRVLRPLAEGGMGALYVVEQLSTGAQRALKVLHASLVADPKNRAQFVQEARVGAAIKSPYVVEVVAAGVDDATGSPWLAMELLEGMTLDAWIRQRGRLSPAELLGLFEQLGHALGRAHAAGVIHRDLKPENLFVAATQLLHAPVMLKVLDFGIAKLVASNQTAATATRGIGSPLWLAPEQAQAGAKLRPATDVWALGLIAYYGLTGRYFWNAANAPEFNLTALLMEIAVLPLEPPSVRAASQGVASALPQGFDAWFQQCVAREPEARFPDGAVAIAGLSAVLSRPSIPATIPIPEGAGVPPVPWSGGPWHTGSGGLSSPGATPPGVPQPTPGTGRFALLAVAVGGSAVLVLALGALVAWRSTRPRDTAEETDQDRQTQAASLAPPRPEAPTLPPPPSAESAPTPSVPDASAVPPEAPTAPVAASAPPEEPPGHDRSAATARPVAAPVRSTTAATRCLGRWRGSDGGARYTLEVTSISGSSCGRYESSWGTHVTMTRCRAQPDGLVGSVPNPGGWTFRCNGGSARLQSPTSPNTRVLLHR